MNIVKATSEIAGRIERYREHIVKLTAEQPAPECSFENKIWAVAESVAAPRAETNGTPDPVAAPFAILVMASRIISAMMTEHENGVRLFVAKELEHLVDASDIDRICEKSICGISARNVQSLKHGTFKVVLDALKDLGLADKSAQLLLPNDFSIESVSTTPAGHELCAQQSTLRIDTETHDPN